MEVLIGRFLQDNVNDGVSSLSMRKKQVLFYAIDKFNKISGLRRLEAAGIALEWTFLVRKFDVI